MVFQAPCKYCDSSPTVNMEKTASGWNVTNLDGSKHYHDKARQQFTASYMSPEQQQQASHETNQEAKITANLRTEAIAKAHEENIKASEELTKAINRLAAAIEAKAAAAAT